MGCGRHVVRGLNANAGEIALTVEHNVRSGSIHGHPVNEGRLSGANGVARSDWDGRVAAQPYRAAACVS